ncbi:MAG: thiamine phosphate synthase [Pseudomonadota bacterium]
MSKASAPEPKNNGQKSAEQNAERSEQTPRLRGLYAITPEGRTQTQLMTQVEAALHGGASLVQYRDKQHPPQERAERARALQQLCRRFNTRLIINDDLALALAIDADGVHLGADDGDYLAARQALATDKILGVSCYDDFARARLASRAGADNVAFGAVYPSSTKPQARHAALSLFTQAQHELCSARRARPLALCAIGGITAANASPVIAAGADLLAVIDALFGSSAEGESTAQRVQQNATLYAPLLRQNPGWPK